jgi:hypothetical protein
MAMSLLWSYRESLARKTIHVANDARLAERETQTRADDHKYGKFSACGSTLFDAVSAGRPH